LEHGTDNTFVFVDGSNTGFVNLLKIAFSESLRWEKQNISPESMHVLPISFASTHKEMLSELVLLVSKEYLCIPASMTKLEVALRTAWANELSLDKSRSEYNDLTDGLRLACKMYKMN